MQQKRQTEKLTDGLFYNTMIGKSSMSNFDQNDTYCAAPDDGQKALVLHFFHYQNYKRLLLKSYKKN